MNPRIQTTFLLLVVAQAAHSTEEYIGRLWEVLAPARFLTGLFSDNHETGFLIINTGLFIFGFWCWMIPVRKNYSVAGGLIWFWIVIGLINGIGHPLWVLFEKKYEPGFLTAPILLILSVFLAIKMYRNKPSFTKENLR